MTEQVRAAVQVGPRHMIGAYGVDARAYTEAIRIIESEHFPLASLHTHSFGLAATAPAIETLGGEMAGARAVHVPVHPGKDAG